METAYLKKGQESCLRAHAREHRFPSCMGKNGNKYQEFKTETSKHDLW